jgi:hypothetical protein
MSGATGKAKGIGLYHAVFAHEGFEEAATALFELVRSAQQREPGKGRILYLDIDGHRDDQGRFDPDMLELQTAFIEGFLMPFLAEARLPGGVHLVNRAPQRDDVPDTLEVRPAGQAGLAHELHATSKSNPVRPIA